MTNNRHFAALPRLRTLAITPWCVLILSLPTIAQTQAVTENPIQPKSPVTKIETSLQYMKIMLGEESSGNQDCKAISDAFGFHIQAVRRYNVINAGNANHEIIITCENDNVFASWGTYLNTKTKKGRQRILRPVANAKVKVTKILTGNTSAIALRLLKDFQSKLPWDSEAPAIAKIDDNLNKNANTQRHNVETIFGTKGFAAETHVMISAPTGFESNPLLANCLPVEIGELIWDVKDRKLVFTARGYGITNRTDSYETKVEGYLPSNKIDIMQADQNSYFRFADESKSDRRTKMLVNRCKKRAGELANSTLEGFWSDRNGPAITTESIELNSIDQTVGIALFNLRGDNGQSVPPSFGGYVHNTIGIGDFLALELRGLGQLVSYAYSPGYDEYNDKSRVYMGEFYGHGRLELESFNLDVGLGYMIDGVNIVYDINDTEEESTFGNRKPASRISGALRTGASFGNYFFNVRTSYSFSRVGRFLSISLENNYKMTKTWYLGSDINYSKFGPTLRGEPGYFFTSVGLHLGFYLERARK